LSPKAHPESNHSRPAFDDFVRLLFPCALTTAAESIDKPREVRRFLIGANSLQ